MAWIVFALLAAVLWGASYAIYGELIKAVSAASAMFYSSMGMIVIYASWAIAGGTLHEDWKLLKTGGRETGLILALVVINALANIFLALSIKGKNATASGLIEITYPLFTALFAWIFLKEAQLSTGMAIGAVLIMSGVACIAFFERTVQ